MKYSKIILVMTILLTILTISAVNAVENTDSIALNDTENKEIIETPINEELLENYGNDDKLNVDASDFNVKINDKEIYCKDSNAVVISFNWPEEISQTGYIRVSYKDNNLVDTSESFYKDNGGEITLFDLNINNPGNYSIDVSYYENGIEPITLAEGTLKITAENITDTNPGDDHTTEDKIEINIRNIVNNTEDLASISSNSVLNGNLEIYVNNNKVFDKQYPAQYTFDQIYGYELEGNYTGNYTVKLVYTSSNKKEFTETKIVQFINVVGKPPSKTETQTDGSQNQLIQNKSQQTIELTLKTVKVRKSAKKIILQAKLKINGKNVKNEKVTFKFNGKSYKNIKTNKNGVAKVTIKKSVLKKLKVGKRIKYQVIYNKKTKTKSAKVLK